MSKTCVMGPKRDLSKLLYWERCIILPDLNFSEFFSFPFSFLTDLGNLEVNDQKEPLSVKRFLLRLMSSANGLLKAYGMLSDLYCSQTKNTYMI